MATQGMFSRGSSRLALATDRNSARDSTANTAKTTSRPDVSFIVAAYNVAPYVEIAIYSALQQIGVEVEVIVVDDGSKDGTGDAVAVVAAADPRVILIRRDKMAGPGAARNQAISRSSGTWLAILDADDMIAPERSRRLIDVAESASTDLVADNFEWVDVEGYATGKTMIRKGEQPYSFLVDMATFIKANIRFNGSSLSLAAVKPMFRSEFIQSRQIRYRDDLPIGEDYHICLACLQERARFVVTSESFYKYRIRPGSQSWRLNESHVERLLQAHAEAGIEARFRGDEDIEAAARLYVDELVNAREFIRIVGRAKQGELLEALYTAVSRPGVWPFVARFGAEALANRVRRAA